jgi:hypothetical protein
MLRLKILSEKTILKKESNSAYFCPRVIKTNELGPVFFIAPELGPFSKVGGAFSDGMGTCKTTLSLLLLAKLGMLFSD